MRRTNPLLVLSLLAPAALARAQDAGPAPRAEGVAVVIQVNDSLVKDKVLPGVEILWALPGEAAPGRLGTTGPDGRLACNLPPGEVLLSYHLAGYVPLERSLTVIREPGQIITTTLTMMLEAAGQTGKRRVQIVLNWGSRHDQVKDADSHLACACGQDEVYFGDKSHEGEDGHSVELDVDDMDWGGPETITLLEPGPGSYVYWVHNYSQDPELGSSDVVVRVILGDVPAGEHRIPEGYLHDDWRPFKAIVVAADGTPRVEPWSPAEAASDAPHQVPEDTSSDADCNETGSCVVFGGVLFWFLIFVVVSILKRKS